MHSLSRRLLVSVAVPLVLFSGVMIWVLDSGFRALSERSLEELLDRQMVALIASIEPQPDGGYAPASHVLDPRLATPGSGLYAAVRSAHHAWRSPSTVGLGAEFGPLLGNGERSVNYATFGAHDRVAIESRAIRSRARARGPALTLSVAVSMTPYEEQLFRFRQELIGWFVGLMALLLAALAALLRWVLSPVRRMEREIHEVEEGRSETLGGGYPRELSGVALNLNALLSGERKRVERYRDTLGNLAHSLKTPLAVMRATLPADAHPGPISAEIDRMSDIIEHQMKRAAASGGALIGQAPVELAQVVAELRGALLRVYAHKDLMVELGVPPGCPSWATGAISPSSSGICSTTPASGAAATCASRAGPKRAPTYGCASSFHRGRRARHRAGGPAAGARARGADRRERAGTRPGSRHGARHRGSLRRYARDRRIPARWGVLHLHLPGR